MRLHVAVVPPPEVCEVLAAHPRPDLEGVQWSEPARWVVKLRPFGHVDLGLVDDLVAALEAELDGAPATPCVLGPATVRPSGWLYAPVSGLDDLSAAVFDATEELVPVTHPQPFLGAVHLAGGTRVPKELAGVPISATWTAREVVLQADRSAPGRPRLETLASFPLGS